MNGIFLSHKVFSLSINDELRREEACLTTRSEGGHVPLEPCTGGANQKWKHDKVVTFDLLYSKVLHRCAFSSFTVCSLESRIFGDCIKSLEQLLRFYCID
jgi:hypothetical protein